MKKSILTLALLLGFYQGAFADYDIVYRRASDQVCISARSAPNTENCIGYTSSSGGPSFDPTGRYILYGGVFRYDRNTSTSEYFATGLSSAYSAKYSADGSYIFYEGTDSKIYRKNSNDYSTGSVVLPDSCAGNGFNLSPGGSLIVYTNGCDGQKLYAKTSVPGSSGQGVAITTISGYHPAFSHDGNSIIYRNNGDSNRIYMKSSSDANDGTGITSNGSYEMTYSPDDSEIIYRYTGTEKLWVKNANDTSNGSELSSNTRIYPEVIPTYIAPIPDETCTDGIKNQNEIGIDFGGVCGGSTTFSTGGFLCQYKTITNPPNIGSGYTFGDLNNLSEDHSYENSWKFDFYSDDSTSEDYFEAYGIASGTVIYSGSLKSINSGFTSSLISSNPGSKYAMNMEIFSMRSEVFRGIGYIAFNTGKNTANQGSVTFSDENGHGINRVLVGVGSGIAMAYVPIDWEYTATNVKVTGLSSPWRFSGMKIGYSAITTTQKIQCDNTEWSCKISDSTGDTCAPEYYPGNAKGSCGFVAGICQPTTSLDNADWTGVGTHSGSTGTGYTGNWTSSGVQDILTDVYGNFTFSFGKMHGVSTGSLCIDMFDGVRFKYGDKNTSNMTLSLSNGFKLSETPWTCSFLGADMCGVAYDAVEYIVLKIFDSIDSTVNFLFSPIRLGFGYFGEPIKGDLYCFMGSSFEYEGKPSSYYDYYLRQTVQIGDKMTGFDWAVVMIVTCILFYILFMR